MLGGIIGGALGGILGGMDRSKRAEDLYGGVNAQSMQVPHFQQQYDQYSGLANQYGGRAAPISGFRQDQVGLGNMLGNEARGNGIGHQLIRNQAQQTADRAAAQQYGAVAGARPGMQAMASRNAMLGSAMAQSAVGEQSSNAMGNYTLGAQQNYGNFLQGARGQDENTALQSQQLNDQSQLEALRQRMGVAGMQQSGAMTAEQIRAQRYQALMGAPTQGEILAGGITGLAGAYFNK